MNPKNVFVNCPFDNAYFKLLKPLLFTICYLDLKPLISETTDSGEARINKIISMMSNSMYSIHDLSRMEPLKTGELPRFNMPFECGIDFGIKLSNLEKFRNKKFLILDKEPYRYQKVISDISGNDIKSHKNDPELLIKSIRDWFKPILVSVPKYKEIWLHFNEFEYHYEEILKEDDYNPNDIYSLTFSDIIEIMQNWITNYKIDNVNN